MSRSHVTTHVLDAATGRPATGIAVALEAFDGTVLGSGVTDVDGRIGTLGPEELPTGDYRIRFDTRAWFAGRPAFYPEVVIAFTIVDSDDHYHVPLLLSPFAYSTYRGS